jgi:hypothetical protein
MFVERKEGEKRGQKVEGKRQRALPFWCLYKGQVHMAGCKARPPVSLDPTQQPCPLQ